MILYTTNKFKKAVKQFKRNHSKRVLDDVWKAIQKIYEQEVGSSMDNHGLTSGNTNGFKDIHLSGGKFILLYRYDVDSDTLIVSAKINDIVNHKELKEKGTFAEPQWVETNIEELDKIINGATKLGEDLDADEIEDWFFDFYNSNIAKILPVDYIKILSMNDMQDFLQIRFKGTQYHSTCSENRYKEDSANVIKLCKDFGIQCSITRSLVKNSDEFTIIFKLDIPLE